MADPPPVSFPRVGPFNEPVATFDFDTFLTGAASIGLPTTVLRRLRDRGWSFVIDPDATESATPSGWLAELFRGKKIRLAKVQCFPIAGPSRENTIAALATIYHETTHAYLHEFADQMQPLLALARLHYKGPNLKDGSEGDLDSVMHESAASYVEDSIEAVVRLLLACNGVARGLGNTENPIDDKAKQNIVDFSFKEYSRFLTQKVFGALGDYEVTKEIFPRLQNQLDVRVLENIREHGAGMARALLPDAPSE